MHRIRIISNIINWYHLQILTLSSLILQENLMYIYIYILKDISINFFAVLLSYILCLKFYFLFLHKKKNINYLKIYNKLTNFFNFLNYFFNFLLREENISSSDIDIFYKYVIKYFFDI